MQAAILDGTENSGPIEASLKKVLAERGIEFRYFKLKDMRVLPCRSCGACGLKSPGRCVISDDMHEVMRAIAGSSLYVVVSPIRFGGYSSTLKKAIDRTMSLGMPFYVVKDGHLLHPMRYGDKALLGIGLAEKNRSEQEANFRTLVSRNALNMQSSFHRTLVFRAGEDKAAIEQALGAFCQEVSCK